MLGVYNKQTSYFACDRLDYHFIWPNALFPSKRKKKKTTTTVTTVTTRTATKTDRKTFPVLSYTKKEDQLLQQFTAGRMRTDR